MKKAARKRADAHLHFRRTTGLTQMPRSSLASRAAVSTKVALVPPHGIVTMRAPRSKENCSLHMPNNRARKSLLVSIIAKIVRYRIARF